MNEQFLSSGDAAKRLGVSAEMVRVLERKGRLRAIRTLGGRRIFMASDVDRLAAEREQVKQAKMESDVKP